MSEQIHDQVSAFIDDELSAEECAFLVRRFERDPESRSKLVRYSLIGSALRGDLPYAHPDMLRRRVHDALHGSPSALKPIPAVPPPRAVVNARWANPAIGLGLAASVAVAALFTVRAINENTGRDAAPPTVMSTTVPTNPRPDRPVVAPVPAIRLTNYLMHHGEYARLSRTSVHSNVVSTMTEPFFTDALMIDDAPTAQREREAR